MKTNPNGYQSKIYKGKQLLYVSFVIFSIIAVCVSLIKKDFSFYFIIFYLTKDFEFTLILCYFNKRK